jgi:DNA polymerase-3 subunit beta
METAPLKEMIRKTSFAVASEMTRYALTGVLVVFKDEQLRMVASDGRRLACIRKKVEKSRGPEIEAIVPPKGLHLLDRLVGTEEETIELIVEENQIRISTERAEMFSRLVEGRFPNYESIVPAEMSCRLKLDRETFASAIRRVAVLTNEKARAIRVQLSKGKMTLLSRAQDIGEAKVELPTQYGGVDLDIVFNPDLLSDALRVIEAEEVTLELKDKASPAVLRAGKDYFYLVMPLTVEV